MKRFIWNGFKNERLIRIHGVSFEELVAVMEAGGVLDVIENPNQLKYAGQSMFVVALRNYIYLIPHREDDRAIFLITAYPRRKFTKIYLRRDPDENVQAQ